MPTKFIVQNLITDSIKLANETHCCLNCRYSYFQPLGETGGCHNVNQVRGNIHPKMVVEFYTCSYWEAKKNGKEKK
jgi:hypothetical protein